MKNRPQSRRIAPLIPTASMADIAFLLVVFFMLTTSFSQERTNVELPQSLIRTEVARDSAIIAISADGILRFTDGERAALPLGSAREVGPLTAEIVQWIPEKEFLIKADRMVRYDLIDAVLEQLRLNGARKIGLLTEKLAPESVE